ncbi:MAG: putative Ig domain-containing protein [Bryobacterales bacterium]|nr:putative Ig domain-containing protein [Bryobacterales bacterium]
MLMLLLASAAPLFGQTPTVTTLTPNSVIEDQNVDQVITVAGTGFVTGSVAVFGTTDLVTTFESATSLKATIPASLLGTPGVVKVKVRNPAPGNEISNEVDFTVVGIPAISGINPNTAVEGSPAFTLTVSGSNFVSASSVVFGGTTLTPDTTSDTQLTVTIPAASIATAGTKQVLVRNPGVPDSNTVNFTVTPAPLPAPTLSQLNPSAAIAGSGPLAITVTGTNFVSGATVVFGGTDLTTSFDSATQLSATIPAGSLTTPGTVQVSVRNPDLQTSGTLPFTVVQTLSLSYPATITGTRGTAITPVNASVSGGTGPFVYSIDSANPPAWLTLNMGTGTLSGTPTQAGSASVTVKVVDSGTPQQTATSAVISITISNPPLQVVTQSPLPGGTAGTAYTPTFTASGGDDGPYTRSLASGSTLPAGLTLSDGVISGTPTQAGVFSFTVQVDDGDSNTAPATKAMSLTIVPVITSLNPSSRAAGNTDMVLQIVGFGFQGGQTSVNFGGLAIPSGSVAVTGNPVTTALLTIPGSALTTPGDVPVTVTVGGVASSPSTFTVIGDTTLTITNDSNLGTRTAGTTFSVDLEATGGNGNFTWSVAQGSTLPGGLSLNAGTGVLSGTLNAAGNFTFTIRVVDDRNPGQSTGQKSFNLAVQEFVISTATLPQARVGIAYSAPLALAGGPTVPAADYQWTLVSGEPSLPDGITFNTATGVFSGTANPIGSPSQNFTVRVSAKHTPTGLTTPVKTLQITVSGGGLDISATSVPFGVVNQPYGPAGAGVTISALNGTAPYRFSLNPAQSARLAAAGFRVDTVNDDIRQIWNVRLSGTPNIAGSFPLEVTLRDAGNTQVSRTLTILVLANALSIQPETLPGATVNTDYSQQLSLTGLSAEEPAVTWSLVGNVARLSLNASTGTLTGRFTTAGDRVFTVQASTAIREVTRVYTLTVGGPLPVINTASLPAAQVGQNYDQQVTASGGTPGYTWQLSGGTLPLGLNFDTASIPGSTRIVGVPAAGAQSGTFTLTVRDSLGQTASREFTIAVTSTPIPAISLQSFTNPAPAEQKDVLVQLAQPYSVELKGTATLTFTPNVPGNVDDPKVLFLNGSRTAEFTIPANTTQAVFEGLPVQRVQTGTVAGTARVTVAIAGGGPTASQEFTIARSAPFLADNLSLQSTSGGFTVVMTGYSTPRDLTSAHVTFVPTPGTNLQTTELTIPLTSAAVTWFDSAPGRANGSAFKLTIPFTVQNGSNAVASVTVTLTNSVGTSNSRTRAF